MPLHALMTTITEFLAPPTCVGCTQFSSVYLCTTCTQVLRSMVTPQPSLEKMPPLDAIFAPFQNLRPIDLPARLVKWMKYSGTEKQARFFADFFADYMITGLSHPLLLNKKFILCPIPLHPIRKIHRGFNQSMLLAESLSRKTTLPVFSFLQRRIYTPTQTSLQKSYRIKNMFNVFSITDSKRVKNQSILLVDDLCTTGSTLREAAKTLKTEGAQFVGGLVIGRVGLDTKFL